MAAALGTRNIARGVGTLQAQSRQLSMHATKAPLPAQVHQCQCALSGSILREAHKQVSSSFLTSSYLGTSLNQQCTQNVGRQLSFGAPLQVPTSQGNPLHKRAHYGSRSARSPIRAGTAGTPAQFSSQEPTNFLQLAQNIAKKLAVVVAVAAVVGGITVFSLPWILSTPTGLKTSASLYNATIPGTVSVASADLGWGKPVRISGVQVSDKAGAEVISVSSIESEASLWSLVRGQSGLGNTTVQGMRVDLGREESGGEPRALAALAKPQKAAVLRRPATIENPLPKTGDEVPIEVEINAEMPGGSLKFPHAVFNVPWDVAALTGDTVQIDIAAGDFATRRDSEAAAVAARGKWVPMVAAARSEKFRGGVAGAVDVGGGKLHLARPLEANIEINRATGQLFLARLNPLLAGVVSTKDSGQLVQVFASPENMVLPTEEYRFKVEPMSLVLGRGELIGNALDFVGQRGPGKTLTMRTSAIRATWKAAGPVEASRVDLQIGAKVHLITWGKMDLAEGTVDMVLAIPADTLKVALRVPSIASGYNLQFPLTGSVERPTVDWKAAGKQLAKLVVRQRAPNGWSGLLLNDRNDRRPLPEPLDPLPWAES